MKIERELLDELHRQGFKRDYRDRSGGLETIQYVKHVGDRSLELQFWEDGHHRVSHFLGGRMSTLPSQFRSLAEMKLAIQHELTRMDHPPRDKA
jgi:hypothetical protein